MDLYSSQFLTGYVVYISRTATTSSPHFHVTCQLPGNPTMQLSIYMIYSGCFNCDHAGAIPIIARNFNAVIGNPLPGGDGDLLGTCGFRPRNDRGWMLVRWVLEDGLFIQSRLDRNTRPDDCWTCQRSMDGVLVQTHYILRSVHIQLVQVKFAFAMVIGLDHRCVRCTMKIPFRKNGFENSLVSSAGAPFEIDMAIPQVTNNTFLK